MCGGNICQSKKLTMNTAVLNANRLNIFLRIPNRESLGSCLLGIALLQIQLVVITGIEPGIS